MTPILKYPRTPHITGSRIQPGDEDLKAVSFARLCDKKLVIEEKLDGSNSAISFNEQGSLILQSRGHILTGGPREKQFDLFKRWANHHAAALRSILGNRYIMYGEWLFARHTIAYDRLPHYFIEFDIFDRLCALFLPTPQRHALLCGSPVISAPVLATGKLIKLDNLINQSSYSSSEVMEGLYIKHEDERQVIGRYKFVRPSFSQIVADSADHWMDRPIQPNTLRPGVNLFP